MPVAAVMKQIIWENTANWMRTALYGLPQLNQMMQILPGMFISDIP